MRIWTLITGLSMAVVIIVSQLFYFEGPRQEKSDIKTEQQNQSSQSTDEGYVISLPTSILPSYLHVEFQQASFCLFEILFETREVKEAAFNFKLPKGKFFQTLFQSIISPNAP